MMGQEVVYKTEPNYWGGVVVCFNCAVRVSMYGYKVTPSIELEGFYKQNPCKVCESGSKSRMAEIFQMFSEAKPNENKV